MDISTVLALSLLWGPALSQGIRLIVFTPFPPANPAVASDSYLFHLEGDSWLVFVVAGKCLEGTVLSNFAFD